MNCVRKRGIVGLLVDVSYVGAECDYLYARIRCRRAGLDTAGLPQQAGCGKPRQTLLAEYRWVYLQAGPRLRRQLVPIFEYFELRLLVVALRYLAAGADSALHAQLRQSLFAADVIKSVETSAQVYGALDRLQQNYAAEYPFFSGLTATYLRQGPGGLEQALIGGCLQHAATKCRNDSVKRFLCYLLDMRNLLALQKHLRWQVAVAPLLFSGGELEIPALNKIWKEQDAAALHRQMQLLSRRRELPPVLDGEDYLLQAMTTRLRREGRAPLQLGVVIDYLWRCQLTVREQGLHLHKDSAASELQAAEEKG